MKLLARKIEPNSNIFLISDDHEGSLFRYKKGWDLMCDMVRSKWNGVKATSNYVVDGGDFMEGIKIDDYRYGPETAKGPVPLLQLQQSAKNRESIKDHLVTILEGNHPWKLWKYGLLTPQLCQELNVPYGTWTCKISWTDKKGNVKFKSFHRHGIKSITSTADNPKRRRSNRELILQRHLKEAAGDCILMCKSHIHQLIISRPEPALYMTDDGKKIHAGYTEADPTAEYIHPDLRYYVATGSFLRMYDTQATLPQQFGQDLGVSGYAEIAEYDPVELGFVVVEIRDWKIQEVRKIKLGSAKVGKKLQIDVDPAI